MTVRPTQPGLTSRTDIARTSKAPAKPMGSATPSSDAAHSAPLAGADNLEISSEARALQELDSSDPVASGALSNERMLEVSQRIADGHYESPEVIETVVQRLIRDL